MKLKRRPPTLGRTQRARCFSEDSRFWIFQIPYPQVLFQVWRLMCIILTILNLSETAMLILDESFRPLFGILL